MSFHYSFLPESNNKVEFGVRDFFHIWQIFILFIYLFAYIKNTSTFDLSIFPLVLSSGEGARQDAL